LNIQFDPNSNIDSQDESLIGEKEKTVKTKAALKSLAIDF
jgi:hypothetical protein